MDKQHPPSSDFSSLGTFGCGFFLWLYGMAWRAVTPFLRRHKRLKDGFAWRVVPSDWASRAGGSALAAEEDDNVRRAGQHVDVWIQAASGGESYLAWELLRHLPEALEKVGLPTQEAPFRVLVTTWTRQGLEVLQGMVTKLSEDCPSLDIRATFFPLDTERLMLRALTQTRPRVVVLMETELWPGLMSACTLKSIPILVLNGRMTDKSFRRYRFLDSLTSGFWGTVAPRHITAISPQDAERFGHLFGASCVELVPNIKFDRAAESARIASVDASLLAFFPSSSQKILLASVREEEESILLEAVRLLREKTSATLIIAPRHMHRVGAWVQHLKGLNLDPLQRSAQQAAFPDGSVIVWDTFGELQSLYSLSDAIFVGGSLTPLGGQNFLEPLALGKIPCCGPYLDNFDWALSASSQGDTLESRELLILCRSGNVLARSLMEQLEHPVAVEEVRRRFQAWLEPRLGGSARCAELLASIVK